MSQDGRVGGPRVHLSTQIHQEYIYKWTSSHRAPTEHYQSPHLPRPGGPHFYELNLFRFYHINQITQY